jgi:DNA (cytosine-5)-methyltransferase 1
VIVNMKGRSTASVADPLPTQTAHAGHLFSAEPIILSQHNSGAPRRPRPAAHDHHRRRRRDHPGCARPMLVEPFVNERPRGNSRRASPTEPIPALDTKGGVWLAEPFIATVAHGNTPGDRTADSGASRASTIRSARCTPAAASPWSSRSCCRRPPAARRGRRPTLPTIVTGGQRGSGTALISPYYGSGSGETCTSAEEPLPTVTAKGRFGVVVPVTHSQGGNGARDVDEPIPTMTTAKGGEFAVVMPVTHHDGSDRVRDADAEPLPTVTGANRGELAFITAQHGERPARRRASTASTSRRRPIAATGHVDLVEGVDGYDILFRMLEPHELAAAMGFTSDDQAYEFAGTKTDQIKQIGNAVSVAKMKACVGAIMAESPTKISAACGSWAT